MSLVSSHIHRTETCRILPSVRRELRNMIEGYASHLLLYPPNQHAQNCHFL